MILKFCTWNIGCGAGGYHGHAIAGMAQWLNQHKVDVCVLQEVDRFAQRSNFIDFPQFLEKETDLKAYFKPSYVLPSEKEGLPEKEYGNCILSRYPFQDFQYIPLFPLNAPDNAHPWEKEDRSGLVAKLANGENEVWIATAHLAYSPNFMPSIIRQQQVDKLVAGMRRFVPENAPVIFGGDLNTSAQGSDITSLKEYLTIQTHDIGPTWPLGGTMAEGRSPFITIDHIFSRGVKVSGITKFDEAALSDHSALVAEIDL